MKTRRSFAKGAARRFRLPGSRLTNAREQAGFIGITQSANLFVKATTSQGLRPVDTDKLPADLRARPSTSLAFEFLDQPFLLDLVVESSPPLVTAASKTVFRIDPDRARSETTIELDWVRGRLSELELGVAAGLQLTRGRSARNCRELAPCRRDRFFRRRPGRTPPARRLRIRLTPLGRDAEQSDPRTHRPAARPRRRKRESGIVHSVRRRHRRVHRTPWSPTAACAGARRQSGRIRRVSDPPRQAAVAKAGLAVDIPTRRAWRRAVAAGGRRQSPAFYRSGSCVTRERSPRIPCSRPRSRDDGSTCSSGRRSSVRFGVVNSLEMRVPAGIADRWELLDKELADREELGREPDGSRRYRLTFLRPVVDKATLRFRYRLPLVPGLDATTARAITIPLISFKEVPPGPTKVEMSLRRRLF